MQTKENEVTVVVQQILDQVRRAVVGKDEVLLWVLAAILARGHILLEDIPGVGKTTMALAFSKALDLSYSRIQFTPDVLPSDITGYSIPDAQTGGLRYQPGAVLTNLFLADELNRATSRTQSALLEVMEEGSVTVDGITKPVPNPFIVLATQNPVGSAGTQMLPESQVDRFMICLTMGYPNPEDEIAILKGKSAGDPLNDVMKVMDAASLLEARREAEQIYVHNAIYKYMVRLVNRTRNNDMIELGISPRGTVALAAMAKSCAWLRGRKFVYPDDVADIFYDVAIHRIRLNAKARINHVTAEGLIEQIINETERPTVRRKNV